MTLERLWQILELEQGRGCFDTVVMGGLDRYLARWKGEARASLEPHLLQALLQRLPSPGYATWDQQQRREWVDSMLRWRSTLDHKRATRGAAVIPKAQTARVPVERVPPKGPVPPLDAAVTGIPGISAGLAARFSRLGVATVRDLLYLFPRRHLDYSLQVPISRLSIGEEQTVVGIVWEARERRLARGLKGTEAVIGDETGNIRVIWFNQPYLARQFKPNTKLVISGKVGLFRGERVFTSPEYEVLGPRDLVHAGRLVPLYPLTQGLSQRTVRRLTHTALELWSVPDFLPEETRLSAGLLPLSEAINEAHFPENKASLAQARQRLAFDELFILQVGVLSRKRQWQEGAEAPRLHASDELLTSLISSLPFVLTRAQQRVLQEIRGDMGQSQPMSRLLQGEVGSGKTVVAFLALLITWANGCQGTFMAPTEILAEQHFHSLCRLLGAGEARGPLVELPSASGEPIRGALLTGSLEPGEKEEVRAQIASGKAHLIIGTHALIQKGVDFLRLGLAVVDEQHRFGVMQRSALREKGASPHLLVMTATPIPRTLALTLYGDLDLSLLDELPPGRQQVKTRWLSPEERERAYAFLRRQVGEGRQAFVICPLIEESPAVEAKAATEEFQRLSQTVFPDLRLGLLHGRMKAEEKEDAMHLFQAGKLEVLVATPVVEVGIDVPNATVMLVEGADRFGLAQLHQFRGRVGRGPHQSYCLLLAENPSPEGQERLSAIERIHDGFLLAEEDLRLRGPGEFFGTRQSGLPDLRMARLSDLPLLEQARAEARRLFGRDPQLQRDEHRLLREEIRRFWKESAPGLS